MHMHAGASQVIKRFGHKTGDHPVLVRYALDQTLVAHRFVHRLQGIAAMFQGDLHLPRRVFGNRRARRNPLQLAGTVQIGQKRLDLLQLPQPVHLGRPRALTIGIARWLRPPVTVALLIEQVKLQLGSHHRVVTVRLEPVDHLGQQVPRVGHGGGHALLRMHADLHRRRWDQAPRHALQTATDRVGTAVDIAHVPYQSGVFHIIAIDAQAQNRARQRPPTLVDRQQFITMQQLAAGHAVVVDDKQLEHLDIRVQFQKIQGFL